MLSTSGKLVVLAVVLCSFSVNAARKLPSYIPKCKADDPQLEKCILDGIEQVRPHLPNGIREINVPPVEPFAIDKLQVDRNNPNLKLKLILTNMKAYGCSGFQVNKFKLTPNRDGMEGSITFPTLNITSDFDINGSVFSQKMKGTGIFAANLKNVKVNLSVKAKVAENGKYAQMEDMKFKIVNTGSRSDVQLLPNPNAKGKDAQNLKDALKFFNSNREQVFELALPIVEETGREIALNIGNNILKSIPIKDVVA
uniref:Uncharacterized protein n=2 Tax=Cacopsylla melanoneura TaxID=428564 RepID=A0A8D8RVK9_9HEMI